ncbi:kinase family protein [Pelomyxa schiedti]|nr:kinase family protein [Pelomyxa schiedti]
MASTGQHFGEIFPDGRRLVGAFTYRETDRLGAGTYAVVYKATDSNGTVVAVKEMDLRKLPTGPTGDHVKRHLLQEIEVMKQVRDPNVVSLYDSRYDRRQEILFVVIEFCNSKDFAAYLRARSAPLPEAECLYFLRQFAAGLKALHAANIIHRDLKPANLLIHKDTNGLTLKIADFGFARVLATENSMSQTICGSPLYMAPEVLNLQHYTSKVDLWSVGVILYEMLSGRQPFPASNPIELARVIQDTDVIKKTSTLNVHPLCRDLITKLLQKDPDRRISWESFFSHEWFRASHLHNTQPAQPTQPTQGGHIQSPPPPYQHAQVQQPQPQPPPPPYQQRVLLQQFGNPQLSPHTQPLVPPILKTNPPHPSAPPQQNTQATQPPSAVPPLLISNWNQPRTYLPMHPQPYPPMYYQPPPPPPQPLTSIPLYQPQFPTQIITHPPQMPLPLSPQQLQTPTPTPAPKFQPIGVQPAPAVTPVPTSTLSALLKAPTQVQPQALPITPNPQTHSQQELAPQEPSLQPLAPKTAASDKPPLKLPLLVQDQLRRSGVFTTNDCVFLGDCTPQASVTITPVQESGPPLKKPCKTKILTKVIQKPVQQAIALYMAGNSKVQYNLPMEALAFYSLGVIVLRTAILTLSKQSREITPEIKHDAEEMESLFQQIVKAADNVAQQIPPEHSTLSLGLEKLVFEYSVTLALRACALVGFKDYKKSLPLFLQSLSIMEVSLMVSEQFPSDKETITNHVEALTAAINYVKALVEKKE